MVLETGVTQFFKKLDIGTFDLGDYLGNARTNGFLFLLLCFIGFHSRRLDLFFGV